MEMSREVQVGPQGLVVMIFDNRVKALAPFKVFGVSQIASGYVFNVLRRRPASPTIDWLGTEDGREFDDTIRKWLNDNIPPGDTDSDEGLYDRDNPDGYNPDLT